MMGTLEVSCRFQTRLAYEITFRPDARIFGESLEENGPSEYFLTLQSLATSLRQGTTTRLPLPAELVLSILRLARCVKHGPSFMVKGSKIRVDSKGPLVSNIWILTPPFDRTMLAKTASMRLYTHSRDQGWPSLVSALTVDTWSWFDIGIYTKAGSGDSGVAEAMISDLQPKRRENGELLLWKSHNNVLQSRWPSFKRGNDFGAEHEIWEYLREGDMIGVTVCAQHPGWSNVADYGFLDFWEWFEPALF
jgi:hypothetical protein